MKHFSFKAIALVAMLAVCSNANAQINLGNILGNVLGGTSSSSSSEGLSSSSSGILSGVTSGDLVSTLTSVFSGKKQASADNIVGTWTYSEPAIVFTSDNFLAKAGAKIAANKIEKQLQEQLNKYGIKEGTLTFTFNEDGTFTQTLGTKKSSGKWAVSDNVLKLTYLNVKTINITTQLESGKLMFVTDASSLLTFVKSISSKSTNSTMKTISSLMSSVNGMKAGITLVKK